jgi:uncharacterized protein
MTPSEKNSPNTPLPQTIDPIKLAEQQAELTGTVVLKSLTRFREVLHESAGTARVQLHFAMDAEKRRTVTGQLEAPVVVQCQRCLQGMQLTLTSDFALGLVVSDEQARQLPRELEPVLIDDFSADLWQMIEDELLLVVPPYPVHDREDCPATAALEAHEPAGGDVQADTQDADATRENPFNVLADLKKKDKH